MEKADLHFSFLLFFFLGLTVRLVEDVKLFTTQTACRPRLVVDKIRVVAQFALLQQSLCNRIEAAMLRSPLHIPFFGWVMKSFAVAVGSMEQSFDISLKDNSFDMVIAT